jgi:hypothetical protein
MGTGILYIRDENGEFIPAGGNDIVEPRRSSSH